MKNKKNCFSIFSGEFYECLEEDIKILGEGQLPLLKKKLKNCKKCYGRGHLGRNSENFWFHACSCVQKLIDFDILKINNVKI